jgi:hypothetical protein
MFMQEKRIADSLEKRVACAVPSVEDVFPKIKPCKLPHNGGIIYCPTSKALSCGYYLVYLAQERQKYRGTEG